MPILLKNGLLKRTGPAAATPPGADVDEVLSSQLESDSADDDLGHEGHGILGTLVQHATNLLSSGTGILATDQTTTVVVYLYMTKTSSYLKAIKSSNRKE